MLTVLLVIGTIAMYSACTLLTKAYQMSAGPGYFQVAFMNVVFSGSVFLTFIAAKGFVLHYNTATLLLAVAFGSGIWYYSSLKVKAAACGPMSVLTMSYVIGGVIVPTLYGILFLDEPIILHKMLGILLILLSFVPLLMASRHRMVFSVKFWLLCLLLLLFNGVLMTISKVAQTYSEPEYSMDYVALYFFFYFIIACASMVKNLHHPPARDMKRTLTLRNCLLAAACGLCNAAGSVLNFLLAGRMAASVQFPLTQSSLLVVVTVMSLLLYREKPDKATVASLAISIASIVLISI